MSSNKKSASVMRQIDENLRRVYRQDEDEQVPDRFQKLLEQLKSAEDTNKGRDTDNG